MSDLLAGFENALSPQLLLIAVLGVLLGTVVGVLPGLGPIGAITLLLGVTPALGPTASLILLGGVYYGSMYGGSTTSILIRTPGESTSVITTIEGYAMTRRGRGGAALVIAAVSSFVAGTLSIIGLMLFGPRLADLAVGLGPTEYVLLCLIGLVLLSLLMGGSVPKAAAMVLTGVLLGTVGSDPISGQLRFNFGIPQLSEGVDFAAVAMGVFGVSAMIQLLLSGKSIAEPVSLRFRDLVPTRAESRLAVWPALRGSVIGFVMGLLPGPATVISTFMSYVAEKNIFAQRKSFGRGSVAGVAGPEAANNAAAGAAFVPLLALGIPFAPTMALVLSALLLNGIVPGPTFIPDHQELFWTVIASMYVGNVMLLVLNFPLVGVFARIATMPIQYLAPGVLAALAVGAYALNNSMFDVQVMFISGVLGYLLSRARYPMAPLVLGLVLGPTLEQSWRQAMRLGGPELYVQRPASLALMGLLVVILLFVLATRRLAARAVAASADDPELVMSARHD